MTTFFGTFGFGDTSITAGPGGALLHSGGCTSNGVTLTNGDIKELSRVGSINFNEAYLFQEPLDSARVVALMRTRKCDADRVGLLTHLMIGASSLTSSARTVDSLAQYVECIFDDDSRLKAAVKLLPIMTGTTDGRALLKCFPTGSARTLMVNSLGERLVCPGVHIWDLLSLISDDSCRVSVLKGLIRNPAAVKRWMDLLEGRRLTMWAPEVGPERGEGKGPIDAEAAPDETPPRAATKRRRESDSDDLAKAIEASLNERQRLPVSRVFAPPESKRVCTEAGSTEPTCAVCSHNRVNAFLMPCGHVTLCLSCAITVVETEKGGKCPMCRSAITEIHPAVV